MTVGGGVANRPGGKHCKRRGGVADMLEERRHIHTCGTIMRGKKKHARLSKESSSKHAGGTIIRKGRTALHAGERGQRDMQGKGGQRYMQGKGGQRYMQGKGGQRYMQGKGGSVTCRGKGAALHAEERR